MTTVFRGRLIAFLFRAGFLTAALAIIAGIFGMHIMTGAHSAAAHAMPSPHGHAITELQTSAHAGHGHSGQEATAAEITGMTPAAASLTGASPSCSTGGACPEMSGGGAGCVLSPGNTTLTAPLPGTTPYALPDFGAAAAAGTHYSYSPESPTPGELSISRT